MGIDWPGKLQSQAHIYLIAHNHRSTHQPPFLAVPTTDATMDRCPQITAVCVIYFTEHKGDYLWAAQPFLPG